MAISLTSRLLPAARWTVSIILISAFWVVIDATEAHVRDDASTIVPEKAGNACIAIGLPTKLIGKVHVKLPVKKLAFATFKARSVLLVHWYWINVPSENSTQ